MGKVYMFHYVRPKLKDFPFINHFPLKKFQLFLDQNIKNIGMISASEHIDILSLNKKPPKKSILLTFDDALIDHYQWVMPELIKRKW